MSEGKISEAKKDTVGYQGKTSTGKGEWLTPPEIVKALGEFDLDPCAPVVRPWETANHHFTMGGLQRDWFGRIWLNPPYDECQAWFEKLANHGNGIALCFNRTETNWFDEVVYKRANAILYKKGRIKFYNVDGTMGGNGPGAGSVFVAYGIENAHCLEILSTTKLIGHFERLR